MEAVDRDIGMETINVRYYSCPLFLVDFSLSVITLTTQKAFIHPRIPESSVAKYISLLKKIHSEVQTEKT